MAKFNVGFIIYGIAEMNSGALDVADILFKFKLKFSWLGDVSGNENKISIWINVHIYGLLGLMSSP